MQTSTCVLAAFVRVFKKANFKRLHSSNEQQYAYHILKFIINIFPLNVIEWPIPDEH